MKKKNLKKIALLDVHAILHRSYHALPDFISSGGESTGALYGLVNGLLKIEEDWQPDAIIACYDLPGPTFRRQAYSEYKAGRKKTDEALIEQIKRSRDIFSAFNITIYDHPGFEADDIIGTISEKVLDYPDWQVIIFSGDLDTLQLVKDDKIIVETFKRGIKEMTVYNQQAVIDRYGFVPKLIPDFKGLAGDQSDNIIGIEGIGEKTASRLISQFGSLEKIYSHLEKKGVDKFIKIGVKQRFIDLLENNKDEAMFSKALATIRKDAPLDFEIPTCIWRDNINKEVLLDLLAQLEFRQLSNRFKSIFGANRQEKEEELDEVEFRKAQVALWVLNSDLINPELDDLIRYTDRDKLPDIFKILEEKIKDDNLTKVFYKIELPLMPIIDKARKRGILINEKKFISLQGKYSKRLEKITCDIYKQAGQEFNIRSPQQLAETLFDILQISPKGLKKTAGGARSTRESELIKLKDLHPIIPLILEYRELQKINSAYAVSIPKLIQADGKLRTDLNQAGTTTGRMSSSRPNLQNIPSDQEFGQEIKEAFVASPGYLLLSADYSQIEMRVLAALSGDKYLKDFFQADKDIHSAVASLVFVKSEEEISKEERRRAKIINFGIVYGMGINALKSNLNVSLSEAQEFYNQYFKTFPTIKEYFQEILNQAEAIGYTTTFFGRRRYLPALKSRLSYIKAGAERMAKNAPIQGTAADLLKLAMIAVDGKIKKQSLEKKVHLLLQIHDELIYEVKEELIDEVRELIKYEMENIWPEVDVPLKVNIKEGKNWGEIV